MSRYVVLLRGINVGRAKRISMADLRGLLAGLGYADVRTHLQSGNAVLTATRTTPARIAARVQKALAAETGFEVTCLVRTGPEVARVVAENPWSQRAAYGAKLLAHFLSADPDPSLLTRHDPRALDPDGVVLGDRVMYQWCPDGVLAAPPAADVLLRRHGLTVTGRNWNTVTRLEQLLEPPSP